MSEVLDIYGHPIRVGDDVAWAAREGNFAVLRLGKVARLPDTGGDMVHITTDLGRAANRWPDQLAVLTRSQAPEKLRPIVD